MEGLSWRLSGQESTCQCRRHGFALWSGRVPHAEEQLSLIATTTETVLWSLETTTAEATHHSFWRPRALEPMLCNKRSHCNERPVYHDEEEPLLEKSHIARKTSTAKYKQVTHTHTLHGSHTESKQPNNETSERQQCGFEHWLESGSWGSNLSSNSGFWLGGSYLTSVPELPSLQVSFAQSCPTLWDSINCSPPASCVHALFQARMLEWVAIFFSRASSRPRDWTQVSCIAGRSCTTKLPGKPSLQSGDNKSIHCTG